MKFINKSTHLQEGHAITDDYLDTVCRVSDDDESYPYINVDYDGSFRSSGAKDKMLQLALANQSNFCCYCMRDLSGEDSIVTLEHVIPQKCSDEEFNKYINLNVPLLTAQEVIQTRVFTKTLGVTYPPRPHTVTFENLTASCDGVFPDKGVTCQCCNSKRGNDFVYPMFYLSNVENEIEYSENGTMQVKETCSQANDYRNTIFKAKLNCSNLKDVRRLWHLFANIPYEELENCRGNEDHRREMLLQVLYSDDDMSKQDEGIYNKFIREEYWNTFMSYHWFHHKL